MVGGGEAGWWGRVEVEATGTCSTCIWTVDKGAREQSALKTRPKLEFEFLFHQPTRGCQQRSSTQIVQQEQKLQPVNTAGTSQVEEGEGEGGEEDHEGEEGEQLVQHRVSLGLFLLVRHL